MFEGTLFGDRDVEELADAVLVVLERVGALYQNDQILKALETAGAKVDYAAQVATFPRGMVEGFVEQLRREHAADEGAPRPFSPPGQSALFHQLCQYYYDAAKRERRIGNRDDYVTLLKLGHALHPDQGVGQCLLLSDVPAEIEPLAATLLQFEYVGRPRGAYVQDVRQIDYLAEIEQIAGVEDLIWLANVGFSSPLRFGRNVADRFVQTMKLGRPISTYVMTLSGAGTPVTVAGCTVIASAELLALWMAGRALNPDAPVRAGVWLATMDMRSGQASYHGPDAMIRNFAASEFLHRWTGVAIGVGSGEYGPAKTPGLYASLEKAYRAMAVAAFTGSHPSVGSGHLDGGLTMSPVQLLLDREMSAALAHMKTPVEVSADAIGLDTILEVGHAEETNYLETNHTLEHFRSALWLPELLSRLGWEGPESEAQAIERGQARVDELVASYEKPDFDEGKLAAMREVVERARKELGCA